MRSGETSGVRLVVPNASGAGAWEPVTAELEKAIATGARCCALDCTQVSELSTAVVYRLATLYERCLRTGLSVELQDGARDLGGLMQALFPAPIAADGAEAVVDTHEELFPLIEEDLSAASRRFLKFLYGRDYSQRTTYVLRSLYEEAVTNIRLHGEAQGQPLYFQLRVHPDRTVMSFIDAGLPFDPTTWDEEETPATRDTDDDRPPFGIRFLRNLTDNLSYRRLDDRLNLLTMERRKKD